MSKHGDRHRRGYPYPVPIDGYELIDVCFKIPNHELYRGAVRGAVMNLRNFWMWYNDGNDDLNQRWAVAHQFGDLLEEYFFIGEECSMADQLQVRQNPTDLCKLEYSPNAGADWYEFADFLLCPTLGNDSYALYFNLNLQYQQINNIKWDGTTTSININAPVTIWNDGDTYERNAALCMGVQDLVRAMAAFELNELYWRNEGLHKIFWDIVQLVGETIGLGFTVTGTLIAGDDWEDVKAALQDDEALRKVACCMNTNLQGQAVTSAVLAVSLDGCGFAGGSPEALAASYLRRNLGTDETYYAMLDSVGNAYVRVTVLNQNDCLCDLIGEVTFDNPTTDLPYVIEYGFIASGGQPALALWGEEWFTPPETFGKNATALIELPGDFTITQVTFLYNYMAKPGDDLNRTVTLYRADMLELVSKNETDHQDFETWHKQAFSFNRPNVRYVKVETKFNNDGYPGQYTVFDTVQIFGS